MHPKAINIIRASVEKSFLVENLQQAEKLYFNNGKLSEPYKNAILQITHGDSFTRLVSDLIYHLMQFRGDVDTIDSTSIKVGERFYQQLINYNKNLVPVPGDLMQYNRGESNEFHVLTLAEMLEARAWLVKEMKRLPSIAIRNLKINSNGWNNQWYFKSAAEKIHKLNNVLDILPKPTDERRTQVRNTLLKKIFNSENNLDQSLKVAEHFSHSFNVINTDVDPDDFLESISHYNTQVIQKSNNLFVIRVFDQEAMEKVGCFSYWCFARPGGGEWWNSYATSGFLDVIINFNLEPEDAKFLMVYIPDSGEVYASTNVPLDELGILNSHAYLKSIGVDMTKLGEKIRKKNKSAKVKPAWSDYRQVAELKLSIRKLLQSKTPNLFQ